MRGSAPRTTEYTTNLNALPLIGSIRVVKRHGLWFRSDVNVSPSAYRLSHFSFFTLGEALVLKVKLMTM